MTPPAQSKSPPEVTVLLQRLQQGDSVAAGELAPLVYSELHRVAAAKMALERAGAHLAGDRVGS